MQADIHSPTTQKPSNTAPKVGFVSLGCPKALTDSELILTQLSAEGYKHPKPLKVPIWSSSTPADSLTMR